MGLNRRRGCSRRPEVNSSSCDAEFRATGELMHGLPIARSFVSALSLIHTCIACNMCPVLQDEAQLAFRGRRRIAPSTCHDARQIN